jgi:hypothetical protein
MFSSAALASIVALAALPSHAFAPGAIASAIMQVGTVDSLMLMIFPSPFETRSTPAPLHVYRQPLRDR